MFLVFFGTQLGSAVEEAEKNKKEFDSLGDDFFGDVIRASILCIKLLPLNNLQKFMSNCWSLIYDCRNLKAC